MAEWGELGLSSIRTHIHLKKLWARTSPAHREGDYGEEKDSSTEADVPDMHEDVRWS